LLNLPARKRDIYELQRNLPELIEHPELIEELDFPFIYHHRGFNKNKFKEWISELRNSKDFKETTENYCSFVNCPLKGQTKEIISSDNENKLFGLMTIGGGSDGMKSPKDSFFDMVRKVFKGIGNVNMVILTDPYILADVGENGVSGGHSNFIEYLKILIPEKTHHFELNISPSRKGQSKYKIFVELVKNNFPNVKIGPYKSGYKFHDRFLIAKNDKGLYRGMFGPSFNGLDSKSIVLYGELEEKNTLEKIKKWFD